MQYLSQQQKNHYQTHGYLVLENFIPTQLCTLLMARARELIADFEPTTLPVVFSTLDQQHAHQRYFLDSGGGIHFFFEENAFDREGRLTKAKQFAINKIGHALHDLDPTFNCFSRLHKIAALTDDLDISNPLLVQSMYICKQPYIGGEVTCHQDGSFLHIEGQPAIGLWFALEDATVDNGCLWAIPGAHHLPVKNRFIRENDYKTRTEIYDESAWPLEDMIALPVKAGSVIVLHGFLPHMSKENLSQKSRHAYTLHIMSGNDRYASDNWLQRTKELPFQGFF